MEQSQNNIYLKLQGLIWSAFLGVVSFQIIVPIAWEYLNIVLNIHFEQGYFIFVTTYALLLPVSFTFWLVYHYKEFKACLFPIGKENEIDSICKIFLIGIGAILLLHIACILVSIFVYEIEVSDFWILQIISFTTSLILLLTGGLISHKRILLFLPTSNSNQEKEIKQKAFRVLFGWVIFSILVFGFLLIHWQANKKHYQSVTKEYTRAGFLLLDKRKKLDTLIRDLKYEKESLKWGKNQKSLDSLAKNSNKIDSIIAETKSNTIPIANSKAGSMLTAKLHLTNSELNKLLQVISIKRELLLKEAQKIVGKQLRDTQLKLTYLLLNVIIVLISLLVFLQIDYLIKDYECAEPARLAKRYPNSLEFQETFSRMEGKRNSAQLLSNRLWLYVTIAVWLIVPLFKPVQDDKIDSNAPFKMLTISRPDQPWNDNRRQTENYQISNSFNNSIDSLLLKINNEYSQTVPPQDLSEIISALRETMEKLETIKTQNEEIKEKVKYLTPN